ncbi:hypothetical protein TanjilG_12704 [Lupinus angustifolius]|uniref:Protein disulfide-isomerase n=1 Tax=Lupinus angustifolius TaxID=3871 RepID=A0A4P1QZ04_LUPAN|nr:PREDICTED: protein disulfide-isomerase-like [Lupinus angustifolius]OIV97947.1 hypothetical protein TanjilG_12704 [Lupinus angustifolius]
MAVKLSICFLIYALSLSQIFADESAESKEFVLTLDHSNFSDIVSKHDFIVVEFYAPWCGHCRKLAPEYEKAASVLSSHDPPIVLAKVDANEANNKDLAAQYGVQGFPTIKILRNGGKDAQVYKGPREADGIVDYLKKQSGPPSAEIKSADDATAFIGENNVAIVGIFPKFSGEEFENFIAVAKKLRAEYDFAHTLDAKLLPRGESSVSGPTVRLFKPFDELIVNTQDFNVDGLKKFVVEASIPVLTVLNSDPKNAPYLEKFFTSSRTKAMFFIDFNAEGAESLESKYREGAELYKKDGISFLIGDPEAGKSVLEYFGAKKDQLPLILILQDDDKKFVKSNLKAEDISTFLKDYKDGKVAPHVKSEPIPESNNEPVKIVVRDNLQDIVINSGKNVLLEFYAPWCSHCKNLAPILDEVAISYESDADVVIAKLDATANDVPTETFDVQGFPTLYFRSSSGKVSPYDGDRTKEAIIEFIEKNRDKPAQQEQAKEKAEEKPAQKEQEKDEL